ncbi:CNT_collapsed_G0025800.mRNA.1.CDS.1 [Saccharomyces cerevisiae]|nr:CNT_collapsed_G0025800.mRNA.1.CDS.1 [Saccharomyces cerevisiae]
MTGQETGYKIRAITSALTNKTKYGLSNVTSIAALAAPHRCYCFCNHHSSSTLDERESTWWNWVSTSLISPRPNLQILQCSKPPTQLKYPVRELLKPFRQLRCDFTTMLTGIAPDQ